MGESSSRGDLYFFDRTAQWRESLRICKRSERDRNERQKQREWETESRDSSWKRRAFSAAQLVHIESERDARCFFLRKGWNRDWECHERVVRLLPSMFGYLRRVIGSNPSREHGGQAHTLHGVNVMRTLVMQTLFSFRITKKPFYDLL